MRSSPDGCTLCLSIGRRCPWCKPEEAEADAQLTIAGLLHDRDILRMKVDELMAEIKTLRETPRRKRGMK